MLVHNTSNEVEGTLELSNANRYSCINTVYSLHLTLWPWEAIFAAHVSSPEIRKAAYAAFPFLP